MAGLPSEFKSQEGFSYTLCNTSHINDELICFLYKKKRSENSKYENAEISAIFGPSSTSDDVYGPSDAVVQTRKDEIENSGENIEMTAFRMVKIADEKSLLECKTESNERIYDPSAEMFGDSDNEVETRRENIEISDDKIVEIQNEKLILVGETEPNERIHDPTAKTCGDSDNEVETRRENIEISNDKIGEIDDEKLILDGETEPNERIHDPTSKTCGDSDNEVETRRENIEISNDKFGEIDDEKSILDGKIGPNERIYSSSTEFFDNLETLVGAQIHLTNEVLTHICETQIPSGLDEFSKIHDDSDVQVEVEPRPERTENSAGEIVGTGRVEFSLFGTIPSTAFLPDSSGDFHKNSEDGAETRQRDPEISTNITVGIVKKELSSDDKIEHNESLIDRSAKLLDNSELDVETRRVDAEISAIETVGIGMEEFLSHAEKAPIASVSDLLAEFCYDLEDDAETRPGNLEVSTTETVEIGNEKILLNGDTAPNENSGSNGDCSSIIGKADLLIDIDQEDVQCADDFPIHIKCETIQCKDDLLISFASEDDVSMNIQRKMDEPEERVTDKLEPIESATAVLESSFTECELQKVDSEAVIPSARTKTESVELKVDIDQENVESVEETSLIIFDDENAPSEEQFFLAKIVDEIDRTEEGISLEYVDAETVGMEEQISTVQLDGANVAIDEPIPLGNENDAEVGCEEQAPLIKLDDGDDILVPATNALELMEFIDRASFGAKIDTLLDNNDGEKARLEEKINSAKIDLLDVNEDEILEAKIIVEDPHSKEETPSVLTDSERVELEEKVPLVHDDNKKGESEVETHTVNVAPIEDGNFKQQIPLESSENNVEPAIEIVGLEERTSSAQINVAASENQASTENRVANENQVASENLGACKNQAAAENLADTGNLEASKNQAASQTQNISDDMEIVPIEKGRYKHSFSIPRRGTRQLNGCRRDLSKMEFETDTSIIWKMAGPKIDIEILGSSSEVLIAAKQRFFEEMVFKPKIEMVFESRTEMIPKSQTHTYFLALPVTDDVIVSNFKKFKEKLVDPRSHPMRESYFERSEKLHIPLGILNFVSNDNVGAAVAALEDFKETIIRPLIDKHGPIKMKVHGVRAEMPFIGKNGALLTHRAWSTILCENLEYESLAERIVNFFIHKGLMMKPHRVPALEMTLIEAQPGMRGSSSLPHGFRSSRLLSSRTTSSEKPWHSQFSYVTVDRLIRAITMSRWQKSIGTIEAVLKKREYPGIIFSKTCPIQGTDMDQNFMDVDEKVPKTS